jgi:predicted MFS family arabinose efflux permease
LSGEPGAVVRRVPALGSRNYRIFFVAQSTSLVGTWMQTLGQAWLVVVLTRDPLVLGVMAAVQGLPHLVFSLFAGALADRLDKRRLLMATPFLNIAWATTLGVLCLTGMVEVWHVLVLTFLLGITSSIELPTRQAFITEMVGREHLPSALGLNAASYNAGRLVGPAIAGQLIGITTILMGGPLEGTGVAFLINAVSYLAVIGGYAAMRPSELLRPARRVAPRGLRSLLAEIAEGLASVGRDRPLLLTIAIPGLIAALAMNFNVLIPLIAIELGLDAGGLGLLMAANGVGALLAAVQIGMGGGARTRDLVVGAVTLGVSLLVTGLLTEVGGPLAVVAALLLLAGYAGTKMRVATNTSIQLATPPAMRGRAMSVFGLVFEGASPFGGLTTGAIAAALGGPAAFVGAGAAAIGLIAAGSGALGRLRLDDRDRNRPGTPPSGGAETPSVGRIPTDSGPGAVRHGVEHNP